MEDQEMAQAYDTRLDNILELLIENGVQDHLAITIQGLINEAMKIQRTRYLNAQPYERSDDRVDQANGFKGRSLNTRVGQLQLRVPQTRNSGFYPSILDKGLRSEKALFCAIAEMYIQGVSTRKVNAILHEMCDCEVSSTQVSRITKTLDADLDQWRNRPLGHIQYLIPDARYEKVRYGGHVKSLAVIWAIGITADGQREILGISVSLSEAEIHWRNFFKSLVERGLHGISYIVSDDHTGLKSALLSVFPNSTWNRCHTHLMRNALSHVAHPAAKNDIYIQLKDILTAPDLHTATSFLNNFISLWKSSEPKLVAWAESNIPDGFQIFNLPRHLHKKLRSSNLIERFNQELKRRSSVVRIFPNEDACLRLLSAILLELHEDWSSLNRRFLPMH